jgi:hypothetical protein
MSNYTLNILDDKKSSKAHQVSQRRAGKEKGSWLIDNRKETVKQRKLQEMAHGYSSKTQDILQPKPNNTGLPNQLKTGIETLSSHSLDDVKVNYNSDKPAQLNAHAYAQGNQIHLGPGQEKHLPHEAWHVVQQKQGRVRPTMQIKAGVNVNSDTGLEKEADTIGEKAVQLKPFTQGKKSKTSMSNGSSETIQLQTTDLSGQHQGGQEYDLKGDIKTGGLTGCAGIQILVRQKHENKFRFSLHSGGDGSESEKAANNILSQLRDLPKPKPEQGLYHIILSALLPPDKEVKQKQTWGEFFNGSKKQEKEKEYYNTHSNIIKILRSIRSERDDVNLEYREVKYNSGIHGTTQYFATFSDSGEIIKGFRDTRAENEMANYSN